MKILGLDMGTKRIGAAVSDQLGVIAQALTTIKRRAMRDDIKAVCELVREHKVQEIVIGYPRHLDGRPGEQAAAYIAFGEMLQQETGVPVIFSDERLTTAAAERLLLEGDVKRRRRRQVIDGVAACLILESYLARRQGN